MDSTRGGRLEAARRGERWAEKEILELISRYARHACRGVGPALSVDLNWEDVAQEAGKKVFTTGLDQFSGQGTEESYLYTVVKCTLISLARSVDRRKKREEIGGEPPSRVSLPDAPMRLDVAMILKRLDDTCRRLLRSVYLEETPYSKLAEELQMAESSVRAKVSRCVGRARELAT